MSDAHLYAVLLTVRVPTKVMGKEEVGSLAALQEILVTKLGSNLKHDISARKVVTKVCQKIQSGKVSALCGKKLSILVVFFPNYTTDINVRIELS